MAEITQQELDERVALLRKFRSLLEQQRNKFQEYLNVLEKQQDSITSQNTENLIAHTELEQQVVRNIASLQKVIVPMQKMYKAAVPMAHTAEESSIAQIQKELNTLQDKVLKQNQINRDLLRVHIETIRNQIQNFKNPYKNVRSVYSQPQRVASLVEVEA
ncbi:MAG: flagellar export chaperone FlgN [Treponema sp.]|nr:flagellar export chaperone FlgN [Treponema sp.]